MNHTHHLLELCERIHMAIHGSGDPLHEAEMRIGEEVLHSRLDTWGASLPGSEEYDAAVLQLVSATIREIEKHRKANER
jgi:hypothetical protein